MKRKFIALCEQLDKLTAPLDLNCMRTPQIVVTIANVEEEDGKVAPRNWMRRYDEPKNSVGGCSCRLFGSSTTGTNGEKEPVVHFAHYGPEIRYGDERDYRHALKALRRVQKGMDARYREFGPASDAGACLDRWLCACGLRGKCVYVRPEGHPRAGYGGWLNRGELEVLTITEFVARVVAKFPTRVE